VQQATGRYSAATETWSQVLAVEPQRPEAWTGLRESWAGLGDRGQALSVARRAVQASPQDAGAWLTIAREAPAEALATLERAARALPTHAGVLLALGAAQLQAGQLDAAASSYARGLAIDPAATRARVEAAMVAEIQAGALSQPAALQLLQIQLLSALQPAEARLKVERLSGEFPRSLQARLIWGQLLMAQGDFASAERVLRALLMERPEAAEAAAALGLTLLSERRPAEALPLLVQAAAARPADPGLAVAAAVALAESGRREQAMTELQALMQRFPLATGPSLALARLKVSVGDSDGAQAVLMTTLRRRPEPELALALASIAASSGQTATAIALLDGLAAATRDGRYQRAAEALRSRMGGSAPPSSEMQ
jgi:tetratricopeptide (TPR) repeat protein